MLAILIFLPIAGLIVYSMGDYSGEEFSPDDFTSRSFNYNQTPGLKWILRKKKHYDTTRIVVKELVADNLIVPVRYPKKNWHLIYDSGGSVISHECDARFLTQYLELTDDDGDYYWIEWNEKFPKSAKIFWPLVVDLARHEMYLRIPDVMQAAMDIKKDDPVAFQTHFEKIVAELYREMGEIDRELGRTLRAGKRFKRSNELLASEEVATQLDEILEELGPEATSITEPQEFELVDTSTMFLDEETKALLDDDASSDSDEESNTSNPAAESDSESIKDDRKSDAKDSEEKDSDDKSHEEVE